MKRTNRIRERRTADQQAVGIAVFNASPEAVEIAAVAGADFVFIDAEHGTLGIREIYDMIRAAHGQGIDALVRVPNDEATFISRLLDAGASGIVVPHVTSADQMRRIVASTRYGQGGTRGACPNIRPMGYQTTNWSTDSTESNDNVIVWGIIEDYISLDEIDRISEVEGVDSLSLGMFDLKQARGLGVGESCAELDELVARFDLAVAAHGIDTVGVVDPLVDMKAPTSAPLILAHSDRVALLDGFRRAVAAVR